MTNITGINIVNGANAPFNGLLTIQAVEPIFHDNTQVTRQIAEVPIVDGSFQLNLVPSGDKLYKFTITELVNNPGNPDTVPIILPFIEKIVVDSFEASVPESPTEVNFSDLFEQTGISAGSFDASLLSITRKLYSDDTFWSKLDDNILPAKGNFSYGSYYSKGDIVVEDGSSYRCISSVPIIGSYITDSANWVLFAQKGNTGTGTLGNTQVYGTAWNSATDAPSRSAIVDLVSKLPAILGTANLAPKVNPVLTNASLTSSPTTADSSNAVATTEFVQLLVQSITKAICPVGTMVDYVGTVAPPGWQLCDGRVLSRTAYPRLFALISTTFNTGGESGTTFRLPDLRGRTTIAPDSSSLTGVAAITPEATFGTRTGASTKALSVAEMPKHSHRTIIAIQHTDGILTNAGGEYLAVSTSANANPASVNARFRSRSKAVDNIDVLPATHIESIMVENMGSGAAFSMLQPVLVVNKIIFTGN